MVRLHINLCLASERRLTCATRLALASIGLAPFRLGRDVSGMDNCSAAL